MFILVNLPWWILYKVALKIYKNVDRCCGNNEVKQGLVGEFDNRTHIYDVHKIKRKIF